MHLVYCFILLLSKFGFIMRFNSKKCTELRNPTSSSECVFHESKACLNHPRTTDDLFKEASVFFHDILNSAGGLRGFLELMNESDDLEKLQKYASNALLLCDSLIEELEYQRDFLKMESGHFHLPIEEASVQDILELTALKLKKHPVSKGRVIEIANCSDESLNTNKILVSRILVNVVKNAVEATEKGGTICIGAGKSGNVIRFCVHNDTFIPRDVQKHLFDSDFSTKGENRGIGMLSVLMLSEGALGGHVHFESTEEDGTYFFIDLPSLNCEKS